MDENLTSDIHLADFIVDLSNVVRMGTHPSLTYFDRLLSALKVREKDPGVRVYAVADKSLLGLRETFRSSRCWQEEEESSPGSWCSARSMPPARWTTATAPRENETVNTTQYEKIKAGRGFFAALDQSGGSTPKALAEYGIDKDRYSTDAEMFDLVHAMRTRVLTSPAFDGNRVLAAILFEQTMDRDVAGVPTARYLWDTKNVVPILKVDKGLAPEQDGVQLMKPIDTLDDLLERAQRHQIFGTKMRSVINDAAEAGVNAIVDQQFDYASRIMAAGLVPIIEPEVSIASPHKEQAELLLHDAIAKHLGALPPDATIMIKITIPTQVGLYGDLAADPRVLRVVALSGGYSRDEACELLARDSTLIASFSRALLEGLTEGQADEQFNARLESSIEQIYRASVHEPPAA
jgi:fructose-bisphosphate aldolase class I